MKYKIILTQAMSEQLKRHLLSGRSVEQMAILLCGINRMKHETRLLGRHLILLPPDAYSRQSSSSLELLPDVQRQILMLADEEQLAQIDWHTHPGESPYIGFSGTDDYYERKLALYISEKIPGTLYASVVMNQTVFDARVWETKNGRAEPTPISSIRWGDLDDREPYSAAHKDHYIEYESVDERFSRQVLAFGGALQERLQEHRIGVIGVGGIGGIIVEMLARLGIKDWVLIDDDIVETSNLNRLPGSTLRDVYHGTHKVSIAHRNITKFNPYAQVRTLVASVSDAKALMALKSCDLIIVATDNHSSRLIANRFSVQYLIPLVHVGVNIEADDERKINDISGEYVVPCLGQWCLQCIGIVDSQQAGWELADKGLQKILRERGYIKNTPAPAVYHLNGVVASLAASEIHNLIFPYKPQRRFLTYDALKGEILCLETLSQGECTLCSSESGIVGLGDLQPLPNYDKTDRKIPHSAEYGNEEAVEECMTAFHENNSDYHNLQDDNSHGNF